MGWLNSSIIFLVWFYSKRTLQIFSLSLEKFQSTYNAFNAMKLLLSGSFEKLGYQKLGINYIKIRYQKFILPINFWE